MTASGTVLPAWLNVSRETHDKLRIVLAEVARWNPAVNLVAATSLQGGWERHILDSAQLFDLGAASTGLWADLGSGGGFPGLVVAVIAGEKAPDLGFALIESDRRKAAFLAKLIRELHLKAVVHPDRSENLEGLRADILTARAFAPLERLCGHAHRHLASGGLAVFPKGAQHEAEIAQAKLTWRFEHELVASRTDPRGAVVLMRDIRRA